MLVDACQTPARVNARLTTFAEGGQWSAKLQRRRLALRARSVRALEVQPGGYSKVMVCGLYRGPEPVQFQPANRVRAGRQQR